MRILLTFLLLLTLTGCSIFQPQHVRDQRRYDRYVRQSMTERVKRQEVIRQEQAGQLPPPQEAAPPQVFMTVGPG